MGDRIPIGGVVSRRSPADNSTTGGAHYLDWLLNIVETPMINVTGFYQPNLVWDDITNEDHVQAIVRFAGGEVVADGAVANIQMSNIAKIGGQRWKLLGSHGAITSEDGGFKVLSEVEGQPQRTASPVITAGLDLPTIRISLLI